MARARARYEITAEDKTQRAFRSVKSRLRDTTRGIGSLGGALLGVAGVGGFGALIKGALDSADEMQKLSKQIGATTSFLSEMRFVADRSGVQFNSFTTGLQRMQDALVEAKDGSKEQADAFASLGLSVEDLLRLSPEQQFTQIGEALRGVEDNATRTSLAMTLFGRSGSELLRITQDGADEIGRMRDEARKLGVSLDQEAADKAAAANDAITNLKTAIQGAALSLAAEFAPQIRAAAEAVQNVLLPVLRGIGNVFTTIGRTIGGLAAAIGALISGEFVEAGRIARQTISDLVDDAKAGARAVSDAFEGGTGKARKGVKSAAGDLSQQRMTGEFRLGKPVTEDTAKRQLEEQKKTNQKLDVLARGGGATGGAVFAP